VIAKTLILVPSSLELEAVLAKMSVRMKVQKGPYTVFMCTGLREYLVIGSGIGVASASMATGIALASYAIHDILVLGIGGVMGPWEPAEVFEANSDTYLRLGSIENGEYSPLSSRMGLEPHGYAKAISSKFVMQPCPLLMDLKRTVVAFGTSDQISSKEDLPFLERHYPDLRVENMEGAAITHAASLFDTPVYQIRVASNSVGNRNVSQWEIPKALDKLSEIGSLL
jgi:nucleoside phosphorylase